MYYCRDCKKVVKNGNVCSCGRQLTSKDEIIYCPTCNKMYFKPSRSFTCKKCNSFVKVEPTNSNPQSSNSGAEDKFNSIYANMFLNDTTKTSASNSYNDAGQNNTNWKQNANVSDSYNDSYQNNSNSYNNAEFNNNYRVDNQNDSYENKFPHKAFENNSTQQQQAQPQSQPQPQTKVPTVDGDFDESMFEDGNASDDGSGNNNKSKAGKKANKGNTKVANKWGLISISIIFVFALVVVFYLFILPLLIPTYKQNWDKYISAQNDMNRAVGADEQLYTLDFKVESETKTLVIAKIKVEKKVYNSETKKYESTIITYNVEFVNKNGNFVISSASEEGSV